MGIALSAMGDAHAQTPPTVQKVNGKGYDGTHLALVDSSAPLFTLAVTTEKGPGVDRMQIVDVDRSGKTFLTQSIEFEGANPKTYVFSNSAAKQSGKLTVTPTD